jgi:hypothetical protein
MSAQRLLVLTVVLCLAAACANDNDERASPRKTQSPTTTATTINLPHACISAVRAGGALINDLARLPTAMRHAIDTSSPGNQGDLGVDIGEVDPVMDGESPCATAAGISRACFAFFDALRASAKPADWILASGVAAAEAASVAGDDAVVSMRRRELDAYSALLNERLAIARDMAAACLSKRPASTPGVTTPLPPKSREELFWDAVVAAGLGTADDHDAEVGVGYGICGELEQELPGGWSRSEYLRNNEVSDETPIGRRTALAVHNICPTEVNLSALADATSANPQQHSPPAETFTTGGRVGYGGKLEIRPGLYRSGGGVSCYWAIYQGAVNSELADNHFGPGPVEVTLSEGQHIQADGCGIWILAK